MVWQGFANIGRLRRYVGTSSVVFRGNRRALGLEKPIVVLEHALARLRFHM